MLARVNGPQQSRPARLRHRVYGEQTQTQALDSRQGDQLDIQFREEQNQNENHACANQIYSNSSEQLETQLIMPPGPGFCIMQEHKKSIGLIKRNTYYKLQTKGHDRSLWGRTRSGIHLSATVSQSGGFSTTNDGRVGIFANLLLYQWQSRGRSECLDE